MRKLLLLTIFILCCDIASGMTITEIMYNPPGSDNNKEYIELFLANPLNLSDYIVADSQSSDSLVLLQYVNSSYALIVEEGFDYSGLDASIYSAGATIGNNLDNDGDIVSLHSPNGTVIVIETYDGTKADGNGYSLEYVNGLSFESIVLGGTPGRENSVQSIPVYNTTNETINTSTNHTANITNQTLFVNATPITFNVSTDKQLYKNKEKVKIDFSLSNTSIDFEITYGVEDLDGDVFKSYYTTTNLKTKSYTPSIKAKDKVLLVKATLHSQDLNLTLQSEAMIIVHDTNYEDGPTSPSPGSASTSSSSKSKTKPPETKPSSKIDYSIVDFEPEIDMETFKTRLLIANNGEKNTFEVWGYVYRGSVCYSGEREANRQSFTLDQGEARTIELLNTVNATPGEYKYKVKIRKNNQKTTTDLTEDVIISAPPPFQESDDEQPEEGVVDQGLAMAVEKQNRTVVISHGQDDHNETLYESKSMKTKQGIMYFLLALCAMVALLFIWKK